VLLLPCFASPALPPENRVIMVRYYMFASCLYALIHLTLIVIHGERAINVLHNVGTEATKAPKRKMRVMMLNTYVWGTPLIVAMFVLASTTLVRFIPYFIAAVVCFVAIGAVPRSCFVQFDGAALRKGGSRPSKQPQSRPITPRASNLAHIEITDSVTEGSSLGHTQSDSPRHMSREPGTPRQMQIE